MIIFDYDDVIVDSRNVVFDLLRKLHELYNSPAVKTDEDFVKFFESNFFEYGLSHGMSKEEVPDVLKSIRQFLLERQDRINLFDGLAPILRKLSEKHKLFIVSSDVSPVIKAKLKECGLLDCFSDVLGADVGLSKVDKIKSLGKDAFFVCDTSGDVLEGKKAGAKTIAVTWGYHSKEMLEAVKPDMLIESPEELLSIIL